MALARLLRVVADTIIIFIIASRQVTAVSSFTFKVFFTAAIALFMLVLGAVIPGLTIRWLFLLIILTLFTATTWFFIFSTYERGRICNYLK